MVKQPCEIIVNFVLPCIRANLAKELVDMGVRQSEVSKMLNLTPAAVSQYISGKRGYAVDFESEDAEKVRELAEEMIEGDVKNFGQRICSICGSMWREDTLKKLTEQFDGLAEEGTICPRKEAIG